MENFVLDAVARELAELLPGCVVSRLTRGSEFEIYLQLQSPALSRGSLLCISADRNYPRLHLASSAPEAQAEAGGKEALFLNRLKSLAVGSRFSGLAKPRYERAVRLALESSSRAGAVKFELAVEAIERAANIFILDGEGAVIDMLRPDYDRGRVLEPGMPYRLPPAALKLDPFSLEEEQFEVLLEQPENRGVPLWQVILLNIAGFSPTTAREVEARSSGSRESAWSHLRAVADEAYNQPPRPAVYSERRPEQLIIRELEPRRNFVLSTIALVQFDGLIRTDYPAANSAAESYYRLLARRLRLAHLERKLGREIEASMSRRSRLLEKLQRELDECRRAEEHQRYGESLLANLARLERELRSAKPGLDSVEVEDHYQYPPAPIKIPLDPSLTLRENAERYFRLARKARRGAALLERKMPEVRKELESLSHQMEQVKRADLSELEQMASAMPAERPATTARIEIRSAGRRERLSFRRFLSSDGYEILVGRTDRENDRLTFRVAAPNDLWLHTADYPGAHVVVRNPDKGPIPERTLREAAEVAAYYSQARPDSKVDVRYTQRKYVQKVKGGPPGLVRAANIKTITVAPRRPH